MSPAALLPCSNPVLSALLCPQCPPSLPQPDFFRIPPYFRNECVGHLIVKRPDLHFLSTPRTKIRSVAFLTRARLQCLWFFFSGLCGALAPLCRCSNPCRRRTGYSHFFFFVIVCLCAVRLPHFHRPEAVSSVPLYGGDVGTFVFEFSVQPSSQTPPLCHSSANVDLLLRSRSFDSPSSQSSIPFS